MICTETFYIDDNKTNNRLVTWIEDSDKIVLEKCVMIRVIEDRCTQGLVRKIDVFFSSESLDTLIFDLMKLNNELKYKK